MRIKRLTKKHTGYTTFEEFRQIRKNRRNDDFILEEMMEYKGNEVIYTVCLKLDADNKFGKKILKKVYELQDSPVKEVLKIVNREDKSDIREGHAMKYSLPDEILELIDEDYSGITDNGSTIDDLLKNWEKQN